MRSQRLPARSAISIATPDMQKPNSTCMEPSTRLSLSAQSAALRLTSTTCAPARVQWLPIIESRAFKESYAEAPVIERTAKPRPSAGGCLGPAGEAFFASSAEMCSRTVLEVVMPPCRLGPALSVYPVRSAHHRLAHRASRSEIADLSVLSRFEIRPWPGVVICTARCHSRPLLGGTEETLCLTIASGPKMTMRRTPIGSLPVPRGKRAAL